MADRGCNYNITNHSIPYTGSEIQARYISISVLAILSTFANVLVIITFFVDKSLRTTFNIFIFHLAILDLLTSIFRMGIMAFIIADIGGSPWPHGQALCNLIGFIFGIMYVINVYLLVAIAICRYIAIVLSKRHLITKKVVHITMIIVWFISIMQSLAPVFGWNRYCYLPSQFICSLDPLFDQSFPAFVMIILFIIPMIILIFCYARILINLKSNSNRMRTASSSEDNSSNAMRQIAQREARVTIGLFILFLVFAICLGPLSVCSFLLGPIFRTTVSRDVMFFNIFMVNFNSLCNPIIYAIWQEPFREAYCRILCCYRPKYIHVWYTSSDSTRQGKIQKLTANHHSTRQIVPATNDCP